MEEMEEQEHQPRSRMLPVVVAIQIVTALLVASMCYQVSRIRGDVAKIAVLADKALSAPSAEHK